MNCCHKRLILAMLLAPTMLHAQLVVDCTGVDKTAYPSINAALADAGSGSAIVVTGPCNEDVTLEAVTNLSLGAWAGQTATLNGGITILDSKQIYLYGLNITNSPADGIGVGHSTSVTVDSCTSNGTGQVGLASRYMSDVVVITQGSFDNNAASGMYVDTNSSILLVPWGGLLDISNNGNSGVYSSGGSFGTWGNTTIAGNGGTGWGIESYGGSRFQIGTVFGPNVIQGNPTGGALISEESEASFWNIGGLTTIIFGNGPVGVAVGHGSQVTFFEGDLISNHTSAGVDVYGHSEANFFGANSVMRNGTPSDPLSAGIRVDGNSEAFLRGGEVFHNQGPGILALVNSSVDFADVGFSGNTGGIITCDNTATAVGSPGHADPDHSGVHCKIPHTLGNRSVTPKKPEAPDISRYKALQAKYKRLATRH